MTQMMVQQKNKDWSPERKKKKPEDVDFFHEDMEVDVGNSLIVGGEDMMVDDMYIRQVECMDVTNNNNNNNYQCLFTFGKKGGTKGGCVCCKRNSKKICRNKKQFKRF